MADVYRLSKDKQSNEEISLPLPFVDEMLERLAIHAYFCFLDGYSGFMQIPVHEDDQHNTTFTFPYGTFA
jgi:imidazoleglycerol phosphate dehydratase HisB